ncbi:cupin domain-containing protein [Konateibacter massiliensis]|uniref:hypothetical protein n=1 Tax=Konateibacter massiliensis TaxID=2002841 RepID=UPI000C14B2BD|nr:hypothetical protein [Konateibacter massiliensis]
MKKEHIDVVEMPKEGYQPLVDFETWRVAVLKYCEDVRLENIKTMQRHMETDEVFVLLKGNCTLITGESGDDIGKIDQIKLEPHKLYNVKKGVWHNHVMDEEGEVLIVENQNTCDDNSPILPLSEQKILEMKDRLAD